MKIDNVVILLIIAVIVFTTIGWVIGYKEATNYHQYHAASRGYGEYCVPDGKFAWNGECGNE